MVQPLWRTVWRFLKKLKIELLYNPAILLLDIYPEKTVTPKNTCTPVFIAAVHTIARTRKQPRCPSTGERVRKMLFIHNGLLLSTVPSAEAWMGLETVRHGEDESERERHRMLTRGI